jgi:hypothetical protein
VAGSAGAITNGRAKSDADNTDRFNKGRFVTAKITVNNGERGCSGIVLSGDMLMAPTRHDNSWVLTAASCFADDPATDYHVPAGPPKKPATIRFDTDGTTDAGTDFPILRLLLGHNGAGKTPTVEVCEGYKPATAGYVQILGKNPWYDHDEVMPYVGVMLQNGGLHPSVRAGEALLLMASFAAAPLDVDTLAERLGLTHVLRTGYRRLSGGEKQRLHFAMAIVGRPAVVFLDDRPRGWTWRPGTSRGTWWPSCGPVVSRSC